MLNARVVEELCCDSRHATNAGKEREIRNVADLWADTRALVARFEADHFSKLDELTARLEQLREGQRNDSVLAVEMDSPIGSITSDLIVLIHRFSSPKLHF